MPTSYAFGYLKRNVVAKTTGYTVLATDSGTLFTNLGAGASVTFTLPAPTTGLVGVEYKFATVAAQAIVISSTGGLITHADIAANTVTTAATIGQCFTFTCVPLSASTAGWLMQSDPSVATTATAVTAVTIAT